MAEISKITLPSGTTYDIKDTVARQAATGSSFLGVSTTAITDGGTQKPTINSSEVTPENGNLVVYGNKEFIYAGTYGSGGTWHEMGDLSGLGALATKDSASGSFTPSGTVSQPTFTGSSTTSTGNFTPSGSVTISTGTGTANYTPTGSVSTPTISVSSAGSTTTIKNPTSVTVAKTVATAAPSATAPSNAVTWCAVSGETLSLYQIGYTTGASITTSNVTVKNGDASYSSSQPTFSGTGVELKGSFSGTQGSVSVTGTPSGTVSQPSFTGTAGTVTVE